MQRVFIGLAIVVYEPLYRTLQYGKLHNFFFSEGGGGAFLLNFIPVFYILGTFLIRQLFHSRLLDIK